MSYNSPTVGSGSGSAGRGFEFGRTHVVRPKGKHQATMVWLHGLGDNGLSCSQLLESLHLPNIKWICPTAPTRPVAAFGGFPCTAWFDVGELSADGPDDVVGLDAAAAHVENLLSTEPSDIKLGVAGFSMGAATALYSATCCAQGKYGNGNQYRVNLSVVVGLSGWLPCSRTLRSKIEGMSFPISHVEESWQTAKFYNNKILVEYKSKDPNHVEWAKALKELYLPGLRDFVKSFYPLDPVWCPTGKSASAPISAPSKPGGPAPPPPPSGYLMSAESSHTSSSKPGMAALFQEISSGSVTSGLRKVTDDMKTKNRKDRPNVVSVSEKVAHASSSSSKIGPPKLELQMGLKWMVENQFGMKDLVISDCDAKQSVYIFGCKDSVLQIQGKVNNITIDKCSKIGVLFMDVVAACEVVNCNGIEVQCQGAPTISVDNTSDMLQLWTRPSVMPHL